MKILVGYDRSQAAEDVLDLAREYANTFDAEVLIVTVLPQRPTTDKVDIGKAEGELEYLRTPFNIDDIECETQVLVSYDSSGEALIQFAKENDIDCIFIGVHNKSKVDKLVFGSTAQHVILKAPCPVMTAREASKRKT